MTEGKKLDQGKPRFSLIPKGVLSDVIAVLEVGSAKYGADNWKHVKNANTRYYDALQRHIEAWWNGESKDPEDGLSHLAHAACCLMFLMWFDKNGALPDREAELLSEIDRLTQQKREQTFTLDRLQQELTDLTQATIDKHMQQPIQMSACVDCPKLKLLDIGEKS